jgi:hypothetical protein
MWEVRDIRELIHHIPMKWQNHIFHMTLNRYSVSHLEKIRIGQFVDTCCHWRKWTGMYQIAGLNPTPLLLSASPWEIWYRIVDPPNFHKFMKGISTKSSAVTHCFAKTHQSTYLTLSRLRFSHSLPHQGKCDETQSVIKKGRGTSHTHLECIVFISDSWITMNDLMEISVSRRVKKMKWSGTIAFECHLTLKSIYRGRKTVNKDHFECKIGKQNDEMSYVEKDEL